MSEQLGAVIVYLGTCCGCCFRSESLADQLQSGSELRARPKRDPREQAVDDEFMKRDYRRDASGQFISVEARPSLMAVNNSSGSGSGLKRKEEEKKEGLPSEGGVEAQSLKVEGLAGGVEVDVLPHSGKAGLTRLPG